SPCAWAVVADHDNEKTPYGARWLGCYGCVAKDFQVWIAGASNVGWITGGPWQGRKCIGCSLVIRPDGEPAARGPYGVEAEQIMYIDVKPVPRPAQGTGWNKSDPH
ncbi:carbon-nitrogen hydrolase family protein, partial [Candidatus Sumerlaeota bacterium]|nr:carbon-nitrogen hydrolase family protein [Candidatus Sumerlaeota bacterium]